MTIMSLRRRASVSIMRRVHGYVYNITWAIKMPNNNGAVGLFGPEPGSGRAVLCRRIDSSDSHLIFSGRASRRDAYRQPGAHSLTGPTPSTRRYRAKCRLKLATNRPRCPTGETGHRCRGHVDRSFVRVSIPPINEQQRPATVYRASTVGRATTLRQSVVCPSRTTQTIETAAAAAGAAIWMKEHRSFSYFRSPVASRFLCLHSLSSLLVVKSASCSSMLLL